MIFKDELMMKIGEAMMKDMTFPLPIKMYTNDRTGLLDLSKREISDCIVFMSNLKKELEKSGVDMECLPEDLKNLEFMIHLADDILCYKLEEDREIGKAEMKAKERAESSEHDKRENMMDDIKNRLEKLPTSKISELLSQIENDVNVTNGTDTNYHGPLTEEEIDNLLSRGMKDVEVSSAWIE